MASTADDIKHMIELAQQQVTHHQQEKLKWEQTLQRLQKMQTNYQAEQTAHAQQITNLEAEVSKAKTTGPAAQIAAANGVGNTQQRINTNFNTNSGQSGSNRYAPRPSLLSTPGQQAAYNSHQQALQQEAQKPKHKVAKALYQFNGIPENNVMALTPNEFLIVHSNDGDWWLCQRTENKIDGIGTQQFAPRNYLQLVEDIPDKDDDVPPPARNMAGVTVVSGAAPKSAYSTGTLKPHQFPQNASNPSNASSHHQPPPAPIATGTMSQPQTTQPQTSTGTGFRGPPPLAHANTAQPTPPVPAAAIAGPPPFKAATSTGPPPFNGAAGQRGSVTGPPPFPAAATITYPPPPPKSAEKRCQALFDYQSTDSSLLSFKRNDIFSLQGDNSGSQWWLVKNAEGSTGYVPSNYVKAL